MSYEAPPKGPRQSKKPASGDAAYSWLDGRPDKGVILAQARRKGVPVPAGLHLDEMGNSLIDENGIRHSRVLKDEDSQNNYALRQRYLGRGYTVVEDSDGVSYNLEIPQSKYEENQKMILGRYDRQRHAVDRKLSEEGGIEDYIGKPQRSSQAEVLADAFGGGIGDPAGDD